MNFLAAERHAKVAGSTFEGLNGDCGSVGGRGGQGGGGHPVDKEPRGPQLVFLNQLNQFLNIMPELLTERKTQIRFWTDYSLHLEPVGLILFWES